MVNERERPDAGEEWIAKAALLGATLRLDQWGAGVALWAAKLPGNAKEYFGVTQARACRKLVRAIAGDEDATTPR